MSSPTLAPRRPWRGARIVLGITGGIAAYKMVQVARDLTRLGAQVDVLLTRSAQEFVTPLSFEGVTGRPVLTDLFSAEGAALHIRLGRDADVVCVAPATADFIARAAQGRADDLLTTTLLATRAPVVICPAMNDRMFGHPQVRENVERLRARPGHEVVGPVDGPLAVGEGEGPGRMVDPAHIVECVGRALGRDDAFAGRHVLVTAGPTHEPIDPVRYIGNRSSGRMGYAIARAAWRRGAEVTLVSGPSSEPVPWGVRHRPVENAREMHDEVLGIVGDMDVSIFAAAVADFRPDREHADKVKRSKTGDVFRIDLVANPDIAADTRSARKPGSLAVGFALETQDLLENAAGKLEAKGFDLIVANDATEDGAGFGVPTNRVTILDAAGGCEALPLQSKDDVAEGLLDRIGERLTTGSAS